jgi:cytochrome c-type biogenesis protein CcmH/NrfG
LSRPDEPRQCPDAEDLGAYLEGTLDPERRAEISRHLLTCDACLLILRETTKYQRRGSRALTPSASVWAIAAGLVIALVGAAVFWITRRADPVKELAATAQAADMRTFEGRLTDFAYAPYRAERSPSAADNTAVAAAARGILSDVTPQSAIDWHAAGVAHLLLGHDDAAVRALAHATQLAPDSATYRSDLAAARIGIATAREDPQELTRAFADAEGALQLDSHSTAARFNRAVALDRLGRTAEAVDAYNAYLAADPRSPWAGEARWRLDRLQR